ncbi:MAG: cobalamin-dependent protein, partial [Myxococcota bacterium]
MPDIVLCTLNASYSHCSLALRYLQANLGALAERSVIRELLIGVKPGDAVETLLADDPRIVGFGVYVWNVDQTLRVIKTLKAVRPDIDVVIGGPEVSYEHDGQEIVACADFVVPGEGELVFAELAQRLLTGRRP